MANVDENTANLSQRRLARGLLRELSHLRRMLKHSDRLCDSRKTSKARLGKLYQANLSKLDYHVRNGRNRSPAPSRRRDQGVGRKGTGSKPNQLGVSFVTVRDSVRRLRQRTTTFRVLPCLVALPALARRQRSLQWLAPHPQPSSRETQQPTRNFHETPSVSRPLPDPIRRDVPGQRPAIPTG